MWSTPASHTTRPLSAVTSPQHLAWLKHLQWTNARNFTQTENQQLNISSFPSNPLLSQTHLRTWATVLGPYHSPIGLPSSTPSWEMMCREKVANLWSSNMCRILRYVSSLVSGAHVHSRPAGEGNKIFRISNHGNNGFKLEKLKLKKEIRRNWISYKQTQ